MVVRFRPNQNVHSDKSVGQDIEEHYQEEGEIAEHNHDMPDFVVAYLAREGIRLLPNEDHRAHRIKGPAEKQKKNGGQP